MYALERRGSRRSVNIWPGFVDGLATLLLVVIFVLMVFMVAQFFLSTALTGRDQALARLNSEINELAELLALERTANADLRINVAELSSQLQNSLTNQEDNSGLMQALSQERDALQEQLRLVNADRDTLASQLAALTADRDSIRDQLRSSESDRSSLAEELASAEQAAELKAQELAAALAAADLTAQELEAAKAAAKLREAELAAAKRAADLTAEELAALKLASRVTAEELAAAKAAAAQKIEELDLQRAELDAALARMQVNEEKLAEALAVIAANKAELEDAYATLEADRDTIEAQLAELAIFKSLRDQMKAELASKETELASQLELTSEAEASVLLLNKQLAVLRGQLARLEKALEISEAKTDEQDVQIANLGKRLNIALANKVQELARYRSEFFGRLRETLGDRRDIRIVGDRFVFQSEVLFTSGSADLGTIGSIQLAQLAGTLREISATIPKELDWVLRVDGHTDKAPINTPLFPSNWELSTARAVSVVKFLISQGIPANRLAATGFGQFQPIDPGSDEIAYRRNRRIELKLTQR